MEKTPWPRSAFVELELILVHVDPTRCRVDGNFHLSLQEPANLFSSEVTHICAKSMILMSVLLLYATNIFIGPRCISLLGVTIFFY